MFAQERLDTYHWLCRERYEIKLRKEAGLPRPWTEDPILHHYHFCNVFRRDDRTSVIIHRLVRSAAPDPELMLQAAILGRMVNHHRSVAGAWDTRLTTPWELASYLREAGINTNAYRQNTPRGLNNIDGVAELALSPTTGWVTALRGAPSLRVAHAVVTQHTHIGRFVAYQIALDLLDCGFWGGAFDDSWALAGPGAHRGLRYLRGENLDYTWSRSEFRRDIVGNLQDDVQSAMPILTQLTLEQWPSEWPRFTIHETEFMLCELDKWVRKSQTGKSTGRIYRSK